MKKLLFPLVVIALCACTKEVNEASTTDDLSVVINTATIESRTTMTGDAVVFASGDKLGIFEVANNGTSAIEWTYNGTVWSSGGSTKMYWKDKTTTHTFYAFSPYIAATAHTAVPMPALAAQSGDAASLTKCDFLYVAPVSTAYSTAAGKVTLPFKHASALLVLNVKSTTDAASSTFTNFSLAKAGIATTSTYNLATSVAAPGTPAVDAITVTPATGSLTEAGATYYAVVNDQTPAGITFSIAFVKGGVNYTATGNLLIPSAETTQKFEKSKKYTYTINVGLNSIGIGSATIGAWTPVAGDDVTAN